MFSFILLVNLQRDSGLVLDTATEGFKEAHKLGFGGFGEVFYLNLHFVIVYISIFHEFLVKCGWLIWNVHQGTLPDGREIAIKLLFIRRKFRIQEIWNEMDIIGRAQHKKA